MHCYYCGGIIQLIWREYRITHKNFIIIVTQNHQRFRMEIRVHVQNVHLFFGAYRQVDAAVCAQHVHSIEFHFHLTS